ncbi:hypothetical protein M8J77_021107 [Diaphorina citri]|nr:hypothetical protein M8J77_021107 [Diaphorina citri]
MKLIVNYLCVSLYYAIGLLISLKYLFLYFVQVCSGASRPAEDLDGEDVFKDSKFDFHEETLKIKEQEEEEEERKKKKKKKKKKGAQLLPSEH